MKAHSTLGCGILLAVFVTGIASAQVATGTPAFGSFGGGPFDTVNLGNLNVHFSIPVLHKAGRGTPFTYDLSYDSSIWIQGSSNGVIQWQPAQSWGWRGVTEVATGYMSEGVSVVVCSYTNTRPPIPNGWKTTYSNAIYHDPWGVAHPFAGSSWSQSSTCGGGSGGQIGPIASDGSGYQYGGIGVVYNRSGKKINAPLNGNNGAATVYDSNGNEINVNSSGQFFDTLSSTTPVLTVSAPAPPSSATFTYTAPSGAAATYTMSYQVGTYQAYTVATNFGVTGVNEYGRTSVPLVSFIARPDDTTGSPDRYTFTYEQTPGSCTPLPNTYSAYCVTGRIASVTLPTGGMITYAYSAGSNCSGGNGICGDGSTAGLTRVICLTPTSCSSGASWSYARTLESGTPGTGSRWQTTVTDPNGNNTVITFAEDASTTTPTYNFYETGRVVNQLISGTQTPLLTTITCYNGNYANCNSTSTTVSSPIKQTDFYRQLPNGNTALSEITYDPSYGMVTDDKEYDYGVNINAAPTPNPVRETSISYYAPSNYIATMKQNVNIYNWPGGTKTLVASSTYTYDGTSTTGTSGTPQHISVSGSRGNLTTIATVANSTTTLYRQFTYYDTGMRNNSTSADTSSATTCSSKPSICTTYNYSNSTATCGNAFPTSISEPMSLSRSMTWNCTGGVATSTTDPNNNTASSSYSDPYFWRPASSQDQLQNTTNFVYTAAGSSNPASIESWMKFNSNSSISEHLITLDSLGRVQYSQQQEGVGSGSYDSTEITYDVLGRPYQTSMPYVAGAGQGGSSAVTTTSYDALGRMTQVQDGGSPAGYVSYTYTQNDVLAVVGPAPSGENVKQVQKEYDGLGRLTSSCAISSTASGNTACNQKTGSSNGILTTTSYTSGTWYQTVSSTRGSQTRSKTVDGLGRMTQKVTPEGGTWNYYYDSYNACPTGYKGASGQLAAVSDPNGNLICFAYDSANRVTGVNANGTTCRHFYYDNSTGYSGTLPTGVSLSNQYGRLVEAATDACSSGTLITDEWFNYDKDGHMLTMWERTPNSGSYYKSAATFYGNGAVNTLALSGQSFTATYGLDGKGRTISLSIGSTTVVSGTTFFPATLTPTISIGTGTDNDAYAIDANTGRMTGYTFTVGSSTDAGVLTWNANGTLKQLAITDGFNSGGTQTCSFNPSLVTGTGYDDLGRLLGSSCGSSGSKWNQADSYDQYGNLTKSSTGFVSWNPGYSSTTNHYTCTGCTYDSNGDVTNDGTNAYAWNEFSKMKSANISGTNCATSGQCLTYDAFGRLVEMDSGSTKTEIWYTQLGKTAYMNGSTYLYSYIPAPGGGSALNVGTTNYYMHKDWLGNARIVSTVPSTGNGSVTTDRAFAPYGEIYDIYGSTNQNYAIFTGDTQDVLSGMWDTPNRELQGSQQGRWLSPDPAGMGWNQYAYATNPNSQIDPSGLRVWWSWTAGGALPSWNSDVFGNWPTGAGWNFSSISCFLYCDAGTGGADGGSSDSTAQFCGCPDDLTSGVLGITPTPLPDLGLPTDSLSSLNVGLDAIPGGIQIVGLMFQYNGPNSYTDANGNLQYVLPGAPYDATVVVNAYYLQVVNDAGSALQGNFTVTEYGMSAYNTISPQFAGQEVEYSWDTNSSGGFVDPIGFVNPSGTQRMINILSYSVDGVEVPTTIMQSITYNNGSFSAYPSFATPGP
jgi:RHS repeat-associated protein